MNLVVLTASGDGTVNEFLAVLFKLSPAYPAVLSIRHDTLMDPVVQANSWSKCRRWSEKAWKDLWTLIIFCCLIFSKCFGRMSGLEILLIMLLYYVWNIQQLIFYLLCWDWHFLNHRLSMVMMILDGSKERENSVWKNGWTLFWKQ